MHFFFEIYVNLKWSQYVMFFMQHEFYVIQSDYSFFTQ